MQRAIRRYRAGFFDRLRDDLAVDGIRLEVLHSTPPPERDPRDDALEVPWATRLPSRTVAVAGRTLQWQPLVPSLRTADLVIVEQASKLVLNHRLLARQRRGGAPVAFWGHGRNFGDDPHPAGEWLKARVSRQAHWWFAYTARSAEVVRGLGVDAQRITVVDNAIDTRRLHADLAAAAQGPAARLRAQLGLGDGPVGLFLGTLRAEKGLDLLLEAADHIHARRPDFSLLVVGGGELGRIAELGGAPRPWLHVLGSRYGVDAAAALQLADVLLLPAAIGLVVIDSFVAEVPIVTIAGRAHKPEIAYAVDGANAVLLPETTDAAGYAEATLALLDDPGQLARLREGCRQAAARHTLERMVQRFAEGIRAALAAPPR
ncbi:glycosyltransferase family 4 protein [Egicoccus halophilus]|uniref:glycosyltransferase family 4 protein n=1 Tax=Egicoccus halophilus TaxID=1670830 RepID=UPI0013EEC90F|nr:glycosyltransferase family 4 protein [Egicoccus halophilus]